MGSPTHRLTRTAREWMMRQCEYGGGSYLHTNEDYPRALESRGYIVRTGRGFLGHAHELTFTASGAAFATRLRIERLLCRRWEGGVHDG